MASRHTVAALLLALAACGGSSHGGKEIEKPKLPPVKPEAQAQFDAGMRALKLGGPEAAEKAIPRLLKATAIDGTLWEAWHNVGVLRYRAGDDAAAIEAFSAALEVNPAHMPTVFARAEAYRRSGQKKKARADYEKVLEQIPDDLEAHARLASLLRETGDFQDAIDVLRDALTRSGESAEVYSELGLVYLAQGRDELADLVLAKATELDPKEPAVYNALALIALARGKSQLAFERFNHATSLDPDYLDARYNKASVLLEAGDYESARAELQEVVKQAPSDLQAKVTLGVALRGLAKYDRARQVWEKVVDRAPRHSRVRGDALFNLALLQMDFVMNEKTAKAALDRFLQEAPSSHPKRKEAEDRRKELGP